MEQDGGRGMVHRNVVMDSLATRSINQVCTKFTWQEKRCAITKNRQQQHLTTKGRLDVTEGNNITYLELDPSVTSPITDADGATKVAVSDTVGATPSTATKRVDGTNRSVYLATSILAPMSSKMVLSCFVFMS
jgi:hypothetical protein